MGCGASKDDTIRVEVRGCDGNVTSRSEAKQQRGKQQHLAEARRRRMSNDSRRQSANANSLLASPGTSGVVSPADTSRRASLISAGLSPGPSMSGGNSLAVFGSTSRRLSNTSMDFSSMGNQRFPMMPSNEGGGEMGREQPGGPELLVPKLNLSTKDPRSNPPSGRRLSGKQPEKYTAAAAAAEKKERPENEFLTTNELVELLQRTKEGPDAVLLPIEGNENMWGQKTVPTPRYYLDEAARKTFEEEKQEALVERAREGGNTDAVREGPRPMLVKRNSLIGDMVACGAPAGGGNDQPGTSLSGGEQTPDFGGSRRNSGRRTAEVSKQTSGSFVPAQSVDAVAVPAMKPEAAARVRAWIEIVVVPDEATDAFHWVENDAVLTDA